MKYRPVWIQATGTWGICSDGSTYPLQSEESVKKLCEMLNQRVLGPQIQAAKEQALEHELAEARSSVARVAGDAARLLNERDSLRVQVMTMEDERGRQAKRIGELCTELEIVKGVKPIPMLLHCPECKARHIDAVEFASKLHHTHACQSCGFVWRPAVVCTVGVQFLPGFKDA